MKRWYGGKIWEWHAPGKKPPKLFEGREDRRAFARKSDSTVHRKMTGVLDEKHGLIHGVAPVGDGRRRGLETVGRAKA